MITGKVLKKQGWTQGWRVGLAKAAPAALSDAELNLGQAAILARLDAVGKDLPRFLDDPIMEPLAIELDSAAREAAERGAA